MLMKQFCCFHQEPLVPHKVIPLSHKNIIVNCLQLRVSGICVGCRALTSCLPVFTVLDLLLICVLHL